MERHGYNKACSETAQHHLTDLQAFDLYYQREITRATMHMALLYPGEVGSEDIQNPSEEEQHNINTANLELKLCLSTFCEIWCGPRNTQADLEAVLKRLSEFHQPKIEEIERVFNVIEQRSTDSEPGLSSSLIWQEVKGLVQIGRCIKKILETQLGKQFGTVEAGERSRNVDLLITKALNFMEIVDRIHYQVTTMMNGVSKMLDNMSK